jgi:hypothetical protein
MRSFPKELRGEFKVFKKLTTPAKVQDFLDTLAINFEESADTCRSPRVALALGKVHCMEGALIAAAALWCHGREPLLLDLKTIDDDEAHVLALFRDDRKWGAISKTNHAVLRYRDAVFTSPRELAMSYFNEYFLHSGVKTMRSYSRPFGLLRYPDEWLVSGRHVWYLVDDLDASLHIPVLARGGERRLRRADPIERKAGRFTEWKRKRRA